MIEPLYFLELAYDVSQRVAIALEVVLRGLQDSPERYASRKGNFWSLAYQASNRLIEAIYLTALAGQYPIDGFKIVHRQIVNRRIACLNSRTFQDLRDFIILRDCTKISEIILEILNENIIEL